MNHHVIEVQVRAVLPVQGSYAIFLGDSSKTFVIYVEEFVGSAITMFKNGKSNERPRTHELMATMLRAFGAKVERVVINHINGPIFHARLILAAENEIHSRKVIELDARPSDSIALAVQQGAPIYVAQEVWDNVEDVNQTFDLSKAFDSIAGLKGFIKKGEAPPMDFLSLLSVANQLQAEAEDDDEEDDDDDDDDEEDIFGFDDDDEDDDEDGDHSLDDEIDAFVAGDDDDDDDDDFAGIDVFGILEELERTDPLNEDDDDDEDGHDPEGSSPLRDRGK